MKHQSSFDYPLVKLSIKKIMENFSCGISDEEVMRAADNWVNNILGLEDEIRIDHNQVKVSSKDNIASEQLFAVEEEKEEEEEVDSLFPPSQEKWMKLNGFSVTEEEFADQRDVHRSGRLEDRIKTIAEIVVDQINTEFETTISLNMDLLSANGSYEHCGQGGYADFLLTKQVDVLSNFLNVLFFVNKREETEKTGIPVIVRSEDGETSQFETQEIIYLTDDEKEVSQQTSVPLKKRKRSIKIRDNKILTKKVTIIKKEPKSLEDEEA